MFLKYDMLASIGNLFIPVNQDIVFGGGDINCHIGNLFSKPFPNSEYKQNPDAIVNNHGRFLTEICMSCACYPVNNLRENILMENLHFIRRTENLRTISC